MLFRKNQPQRERFERLTEDIFPSLLGTALRLTRQQDEAEDLTQEAIIRAYEAFDRFDGKNFKAWMLKILTNLYINRYRRKKRRGVHASLEDEAVAEPVAPAEEAPDRTLFDNILGAEIEQALEKVPEVFRLAVILSDIEGLSYEEIAEITEAPIGTVRSRIARGRAHLRKELEQYAIEMGYLRQEQNQ